MIQNTSDIENQVKFDAIEVALAVGLAWVAVASSAAAEDAASMLFLFLFCMYINI